MSCKVKIIEKNSESGVALIAAVMAVTVLLAIGLSFAFNMRLEEKCSINYIYSMQATYVAQAGIDRVVAELRNDSIIYDAYTDSWSTDFNTGAALSVDNDGDGTNDSRWMDVKFPNAIVVSSVNNLIAQYAIYVVDESSKVNVNVAGNLFDNNGTADDSDDLHATNEGWSISEISLTDCFDAITGVSTANAESWARSIIKYRENDADSNDGREAGQNNNDDDNDGAVGDGIDNDCDWVQASHDINNNGIPEPGETNVDEANELRDEPDECSPSNPLDDDGPFQTIEEVKFPLGSSAYNTIEKYITVWSYDKTDAQLNINTVPAIIADIDTALSNGGISDDAMRCQVAVNIADYVDGDSNPQAYTVGTDTYYGIEWTPYINEVEADVDDSIFPPGLAGRGEYIELFYPYYIDGSSPFDLEPYRIVQGATVIVDFDSNDDIQERGYFVVADNANAYENTAGNPPPMRGFDYAGDGNGGDSADKYVNFDLDDNGSKPLIFQSDDGSVIIEIANYGNTANNNKITSQKNDPRVDSFDVTQMQTADDRNANWNPTVGEGVNAEDYSSFFVKDYGLSNVGEIGRIHDGTQWGSVYLDEDSTYQNIFNYITVLDPQNDGQDNDNDGTTDSSDPDEIKVYGRININTAPREVLLALPGVTTDGSGSTLDVDNIIDYRDNSVNSPFDTIGEILELGDTLYGTNGIDAMGKDGLNNDGDRGPTSAAIIDEDDEWERIFRNLSNLITVRSNVFTVWITAEVWRDLDVNNSIDPSDDKLAEKKIKVVIDRGRISTDPIKILYYREMTE